MTQEEGSFEQELQRLARELDPAPEVPREEIWARIEAARRPRADAGDVDGVIPLAARRRRPPAYLRWGGALAAMLVLGIAIGRLTLARDPAAGPLAGGAGATDTAVALPYRVAAEQYLARTEALLVALPADARAGQTGQVATWAGDLLTDTRLLLDSPAGRDPELRQLLRDLELVLAQIAALPADRPEGEVEIIQDGIDQRYVLLRLRAATTKPIQAAS